MIKSKKQMFTVIGVFALILMLTTITYAFFNYTRTGTANTIKTGRIAFNAEQGDTVTLDGLFPITTTGEITASTPGVGSLSIHVTGDTTYNEGIEYLVKAVNVTGSNGTSLPISVKIEYTANNNKTIGTADDSYYTNRGGNSSIYKLLSTDTIENNGDLVVGYIAPGQTGIDGNITIMAWLDAANIAITDTIEEGNIEVPGYDNGTDTDWIDGRTVFTTEEWNALTASGVSFQVKVEANEGIWVEDPNPTTAIFDTGSVVNIKLDLLSIDEEYTGQTQRTGYGQFEYLKFNRVDNVNLDEIQNKIIISAANSQRPIYAWLDGNDTLLWYSDANTVYLNEDSGSLFEGFDRLGEFQGLDTIDTSMVTNMSKMFYFVDGIIDNLSLIANWDVSNVEDMSYMFFNILMEAPVNFSLSILNDWDVRNVTNFDHMFQYDQSDRSIYASGSSINDITFPIFTLRPGTWNNEVLDAELETRSGTYVPNA